MTEKQRMLASMLAGEPTKESEAIRKIAEKAEGNIIPTTYLQEQTYLDSLPSANNLDISLTKIKTESMLGGLKPLPSVSEDDLSYLFGPNKGKAKPQKQNIPSQPARVITEDRDRFDDIDLVQELKAKVKLNNSGSQPVKLAQESSTGTLTPDLKKMIESYVYEILSEVISDANNHLVNKEQIKIQIGESLFIGNLQKALVMPDKK